MLRLFICFGGEQRARGGRGMILAIGIVACILLAYIIIEYYEEKTRNTHYDLKTGKVVKRKR